MDIDRHIQIPKKSGLLPDEKMVYIAIKRYMDSKTMEAFPSINTIKKHTGYSKPYIIKLIKALEDKGYLKTTKSFGKQTIYKFNNLISYDPLSYEFLDHPKLDKDEKKTIACETELMYVDDSRQGKISMSDRQIALATGLDRKLLKRTHDSLEEKGLMHQIPIKLIDKETGLAKTLKIYELDALGQAVLCTLRNHENRIESVEDRVEKIEKTLKVELYAQKQETAKYKMLYEQLKKTIPPELI